MTASKPGVRVLLVDDSKDAILTNALLIREMGHQVETAENGDEAMSAARRFRPDLAIVDLVLPDIDGCDLARDLKRQLPDIRVFILSGYDELVARQRAEEVGCEEYFVKPLDGRVLERLLNSSWRTPNY